MRKSVVCLLAAVALSLLLTAPPAYADDQTSREGVPYGLAVEVARSETDAVGQMMAMRGIEGNVSFEVLYSHDGVPEFIMGTADTGYYLIADRILGEVIEWGDGPGPYAGYAREQKFYGGIAAYAVSSGKGYLEPSTGRALLKQCPTPLCSTTCGTTRPAAPAWHKTAAAHSTRLMA
jgi:hypothetical protein